MNKRPFEVNLNPLAVLKQLNLANNKIGKLKGVMKLLPNLNLVLSLLVLVNQRIHPHLKILLQPMTKFLKS